MVSPKNNPPPFLLSNQQYPPTVTETNHIHYHSPSKRKHLSLPRDDKHFNFPTQKDFSSPNGSFLDYVENNPSKKEPPNQNTDLTWVNTLAAKLT